MSSPLINIDDCTGCGLCVDECALDVLAVQDGIATVVSADDCVACELCLDACPMSAITEIA